MNFVLKPVKKLTADSETFDRLWDAINSTRESTTVVKVNRQDIIDVLRDHQSLCAQIREV